MILELHDAEVGNSLNGRVNEIDYDYQAEQWVQELFGDTALVEFRLLDSQGIRARWTRGPDRKITLVERTDRFTGRWQLNLAYP